MLVPQYLLAASLPDGVTYWIQTALPGDPPAALTQAHVPQLLDQIERQAGQGFADNADWSAYVRAVVYQGESGWQDSLAGHSAETRAVLDRLVREVAGHSETVLRADDLTHGDMGPDNVLVAGDTVTGLVDWDAAGNGDRGLDLSKLLSTATAIQRCASFSESISKR